METVKSNPNQLSNVNSDVFNNFKDCYSKPISNSDTIYYGVYIPTDIQIQDSDSYSNVFEDKLEALKIVRKYKKARFKAFNFYHEAMEFALQGSECVNSNTSISKSESLSPVLDSSGNSTDMNQLLAEKPPAFRGPKSQDLVKLRKEIECGDVESVQKHIWENPRYLISSGDTPSILQEGGRYNALHIAAKAKYPTICELILNTISNNNFIKLLYGDENHQNADERAKILLDLYLNTPDKALNETPLHFAVKFGALEVVELLVSFPQCNKSVRNKFGKTPVMIICDRYEEASVLIKNKMAVLLDETFYVPVLRAEDNCIPPIIGEPFDPSSPPDIKSDIIRPRMEIRAYAGPMNKKEAENFRRLWKTSPRSLKMNSSLVLSSQSLMESPTALKLKDLDKGLERVGKALASKYEVGWKEYWPFLNNFVDLSSTEGLQLFENHLAQRFFNEYSSSSPEITANDSIQDDWKVDKNSFENDSTNYGRIWCEGETISSIPGLCKNFESCTLSENNEKIKSYSKPNTDFLSITTDALSELQLFIPDLSPFLCIEKSCQVFAYRISNDIIHSLENDFSNTIVKLEAEINQLQMLIASFMSDSRFVVVNFHLVHYRLGCLISTKLKEELIIEDKYEFLKKTLENLFESYSKLFDYFSSDDESPNYGSTAYTKKKCTSRNKQVMCLLECILTNLKMELKSNISISSEQECIAVWGKAKRCTCIWQTMSVKKGSTIKKTRSYKYTTRALTMWKENDGVLRQLSFDDSNKDQCDINNVYKIISKSSGSQSTSSSTSGEFLTPPGTPTKKMNNSHEIDSSDEDIFEDSFSQEKDIFIEGNLPTKTDYAAYNSVMCVQNKLNPQDYPFIYKWQHIVSLYSDNERKLWPNPSLAKYSLGSPIATSTPPHFQKIVKECSAVQFSTPPSSWLRITGIHSPKESLKRYQRNNVSFNL